MPIPSSPEAVLPGRFKSGEDGKHDKLLTRIVVGDVVVDHETVQRTFPEGRGEVDVICTYQIEGGEIDKAWSKMGERRLYAFPP